MLWRVIQLIFLPTSFTRDSVEHDASEGTDKFEYQEEVKKRIRRKKRNVRNLKRNRRGIIETTVTEFARRHGIRKEFMPSLGPCEIEALTGFMTSPRRLAKATESLLFTLLAKPVKEVVH